MSQSLPQEMTQQIKSVVCEILELEESEVSETSRFKEDHHADSLRAIEILATLEKTYAIKIPQAEMAKMTNLLGVFDVVQRASSAKA